MAKVWIKLYTEALHDRKMRKLERFDKSVFYDLLLLAGQEDADGYLPNLEDIAFELDLDIEEAEKSVNNLIRVGLLSKEDNGDIYVTSFVKRQNTNLSGAEKTQRYRERLRQNQNQNNDVTKHEVTHVTDNKVTPVTKHEVTKVTVEKEIDKDIDKDKEEEKDNIAKTDVSAQEKTKLTPDDDDFWNFAKENKEYAKTFYKTTGISPVKSQFGRWVNDIKDLREAEISVEQMIKTIDYMQSEDIPIAAPGSLLKTAQWLKARGKIPAKRKEITTEPQKDRWDIANENLKAKLSQMGTADHNNAYALFGSSNNTEVYDL